MLIIDIKVVPSSGKNMCKLNKNGVLMCYLKSPPERGLANSELIKYLAKMLKLAQQDIVIIGGMTSRNKRIRMSKNITQEEVFKALGIEEQMNFI